MSLVVPGHALARCFGIPEPGPVTPGVGWYVDMTATAADGQRDTARFGVSVNATDWLDPGLDLQEDFSNPRLSLFFQVNVTRPELGRTEFAVFLNVSINADDFGEASWLLVILYAGSVEQEFRLEWNVADVAEIPSSWSLAMTPPSAHPVDLRTRDSVEFVLTPGEVAIPITGRNSPPDSSTGLPPKTLVFAGITYGALVGLLLALRAHRRKRRTPTVPTEGRPGPIGRRDLRERAS